MSKFTVTVACMLSLIGTSNSHGSSHEDPRQEALMPAGPAAQAVNNINHLAPQQTTTEDPDLSALRAFLKHHPKLRAQLAIDGETHETHKRQLHALERHVLDLTQKHREEVYQLKVELNKAQREKQEVGAAFQISGSSAHKAELIAQAKIDELRGQNLEHIQKIAELDRKILELEKKLITSEAIKREDDGALEIASYKLEDSKRKLEEANQFVEHLKKQEAGLTEFYKSLHKTHSADETTQALIDSYIAQIIDLKQALFASQAETKRLQLE